MLVAGVMLASVLAATAQAPPADDDAEMPASEAAATADVNDPDIMKDIDVDKLDWSQLDLDASTRTGPTLKGPRQRAPVPMPFGRITQNRTAPPRSRSSNRSRRSGMPASAPT